MKRARSPEKDLARHVRGRWAPKVEEEEKEIDRPSPAEIALNVREIWERIVGEIEHPVTRVHFRRVNSFLAERDAKFTLPVWLGEGILRYWDWCPAFRHMWRYLNPTCFYQEWPHLCAVPELLHPMLNVTSMTMIADDNVLKTVRKTWVELHLANNSAVSVKFIFWADGTSMVEFGGHDFQREERHFENIDDLLDTHLTSMLMHTLFFSKTQKELDMCCEALNAAVRLKFMREPPIGPRPPGLGGDEDEDSEED
jgi:hypothetical protein